MADDSLPDALADLTPSRLSGLFGRRIGEVGCTPLEDARGFTGARFGRLVLDGGDALVAKLAPADPAMRRRMADANAREVAFYAGLAQQTPCVPRARLALANAAGQSLLLLPDLSDHAAVSLPGGCPPDRARAALRALARIHARHWDAPPALVAADPAKDFDFAAHWLGFRVAHPALPPPLVALGDRIAARGLALPPGPWTLTHGDAQVENVLFDLEADAGAAAVWIDWQMAGWGPGASDVAYFLISSVDPAAWRDLLALWGAEVAALGVAPPDPARLALHLDHGLACKLVLTVVATQSFDTAGPDRAAYRRADLARLIALAEKPWAEEPWAEEPWAEEPWAEEPWAMCAPLDPGPHRP